MNKAAGMIIIVFVLSTLYLILHHLSPTPVSHPIVQEPVAKVRVIAYGDINLGRNVGQKILKGDTTFPFNKIDLFLDSADIIFANLESPISEQNGETVSPKSNIVFTAPPLAARTLKQAGLTILSTANNHALDYGVDGAIETINYLQQQNILHIGTSLTSDSLFKPVIIEKNKIKFAIFAVTEFVNFNPKQWWKVVAPIDTLRLKEELSRVRDKVDVIILSCHGGTEYGQQPSESIRQFALWCATNGVDLFLGHHPHVTYGVEKINRSILILSLGNFIFYQPQMYWTQRSYGVSFMFEKKDRHVKYDIERFIPLSVGFQTHRMTDTAEIRKLKERTQQFSTIELTTYWK